METSTSNAPRASVIWCADQLAQRLSAPMDAQG